MALKAGYVGVKLLDALKLKKLPGIKSIGEGLTLTSDGELEATGTTVAIEPNPEGAATVDLDKLKIGETIYGVNDNTKCYQTDDGTESAIVDADYVPFYDASALAPKKSTWSNFCNKIQAKLTAFVDWVSYAKTGVHNIGRVQLDTQTSYDVTFTHNADDSISVSGTESKGSDNNLPLENPLTRYNGMGNIIFSFEISDFSKTAGAFAVGIYDGANWINFTLVEENGLIEIPVNAEDNTFTNNSQACILTRKDFAGSMTIKYMVRVAKDTNTDYTPPVMTNAELTKIVNGIKYATFPFTYTTSTTAGNVQAKEVTTGINKADVLMVSAETGGTNDSADICAVRDGKVNLAITNLLGHSSSSEITGTVFLIYKE